MGGISNILLVCVAVPLLLTLLLLDKKARLPVGFLIIGLVLCLLASLVNGFVRDLSGAPLFHITTTYTPITEEILKAIPILLFAFLISDRREALISIGMAEGIGFAILENGIVLISNAGSVSLLWAFQRALGASLMHGLCTASVGIGLSFVHKKKKLFYTGTFALLSTAIVYHAVYNMLVQSSVPYAGFLLPILTYIPLTLSWYWAKKKSSSETADREGR